MVLRFVEREKKVLQSRQSGVFHGNCDFLSEKRTFCATRLENGFSTFMEDKTVYRSRVKEFKARMRWHGVLEMHKSERLHYQPKLIL